MNTAEDFMSKIAALQAAFKATHQHPPKDRRVYVLGIIDTYGAVHSVIPAHVGAIHEDFWPLAYKKWRYALWAQSMCVLGDKQDSAEHTLDPEEAYAVARHLQRKGLLKAA